MNGDFKNITIMGSTDWGNGPRVSYAKYFNNPELNGDTLKLTVRTSNGKAEIPPFSYIYVTLEQNISSAAFIGLASPVPLRYSVNDISDQDGPLIRRFTASFDGETEADSNENLRRVKANDTVYLCISAFDQITKTDLHEVNIIDTSLPMSSNRERYWYMEDKQTGDVKKQRLINNIDPEGLLPGIFIFPYTVKSGSPGIITLEAEVMDAWGNPSAYSSYRLYRE
jgi:hypothetical protein